LLTDFNPQKEYCPPLDSATFLAIISDYDLGIGAEVEAARAVLDALKESAEIEEAMGFDPSGNSGGRLLVDGEGSPEERSEAESGSGRGWSSITDDTSLSQEIRSLDLEDEDSDGRGLGLGEEYGAELAGLDEENKERVLMETFPGLKPFDVQWTLKKCKGDVGMAVESLLSQMFIEETGTRHRGVEAFSEGGGVLPRKKGKGKKAGRKTVLDVSRSSTPVAEPSTVTSKWHTAKEDVEFISMHTNLPVQQVTSLYHKNGATIVATINAIIEAHNALGITCDDAQVHINAYDLAQDFPTLPQNKAIALTQLTHPSTSSAHALAKELTAPPTVKGGINISFRLPPPNLSAPSSPKPFAHNAVHATTPSTIPTDPGTAAALASGLKSSRNTNFNKAAAAYRRGKSDHLMGGAAAYYSSLGRDADVRLKSAESDAADALVSAQSSKTQLDLHGVSVKDAVRIARERVTAWWAATGDSTSLGGGYRIVTGLGRHSEGGRGKLGPAVGGMLIREGWKVEVGSGVLLVTGVTKKR
jgi:hypothetical protein